MKNNVSVKANASAFIEVQACTNTTPFDIVAAMEDNFRRNHLVPVDRLTTREQLIRNIPLTQVIEENPVMGYMATELAAFQERRRLAEAEWVQKTRLMSHFGRWLQKDEIALANKAKEGLESMEDRMAVLPYIVDKIQSRKEWKAEQNRPQDPASYVDDSLTYELPPRTTGRSHEPAFYKITGPSGTTIDLSLPSGNYKPVLSANPNSAFRRFIARLNIEMDGGEVEILNRLLKTAPIELENEQGEVIKHYVWLPSYVSQKVDGVWFVTVGWRKNPVCAASRYWLDENEELTQSNPNIRTDKHGETWEILSGEPDYTAPLTLSQLDYHLLCESSDLAVCDEEGETVEFMNEEEEFLTMFPERSTDETFIDTSRYCEDDEELELIQACSSVIERSEGGVTEGDLQSQQFVDDYISKGIARAACTIQKCKNTIADGNGDALTEQILENMEKHLARLKRLDDQWNRFVGGSETIEDQRVLPAKPTTYGAERENAMREPVKSLPCMFVMPHGNIEAPLVREVDVMPPHRTVIFTMSEPDTEWQSRVTAKRQRIANRMRYYDASKLDMQNVTTRRLAAKDKLAVAEGNAVKMLMREKAAALTFQDALESAFGA